MEPVPFGAFSPTGARYGGGSPFVNPVCGHWSCPLSVSHHHCMQCGYGGAELDQLKLHSCRRPYVAELASPSPAAAFYRPPAPSAYYRAAPADDRDYSQLRPLFAPAAMLPGQYLPPPPPVAPLYGPPLPPPPPPHRPHESIPEVAAPLDFSSERRPSSPSTSTSAAYRSAAPASCASPVPSSSCGGYAWLPRPQPAPPPALGSEVVGEAREAREERLERPSCQLQARAATERQQHETEQQHMEHQQHRMDLDQLEQHRRHHLEQVYDERHQEEWRLYHHHQQQYHQQLQQQQEHEHQQRQLDQQLHQELQRQQSQEERQQRRRQAEAVGHPSSPRLLELHPLSVADATGPSSNESPVVSSDHNAAHVSAHTQAVSGHAGETPVSISGPAVSTQNSVHHHHDHAVQPPVTHSHPVHPPPSQHPSTQHPSAQHPYAHLPAMQPLPVPLAPVKPIPVKPTLAQPNPALAALVEPPPVQASHVEPSPVAVASTAEQEDQEPIMVDVEDTNDQDPDAPPTPTAPPGGGGDGSASLDSGDETSLSPINVDIEVHCLICSTRINLRSDQYCDVYLDNIVTVRSRLPVSEKLGRVLRYHFSPELLYSHTLCRRCFNIINGIDQLEGRLDELRTEVRDKFSITCRDRGLHPDHFPARPESGAGRAEETSSDSSARRAGSGATDASPGTVEYRETATSPLPVVDSSRDRGTQTAPPSLPWQCRRCGRAFRYRSALRRHYTAHTGARTGSRPQPPPPVPARLRCSWCRCALESKTALLAHVCPEKLKRPKCPDCGREFRQRRNMLAHQRICRGEDRLTCEECGGKVKDKHALGRHMLIHRSGPMNCHICAKSFTKESDLKRHERTHDKVKSHVCETCGKLFSSTSNYNQHVRKVHKGAKAFKCTECPKSYPYRSSLKLHMKSHGGEKTFACDQCDKKFLYKNNLTRHLKSHEAAPPIKCTKCDSVFSGKSLLKSHALTCY